MGNIEDSDRLSPSTFLFSWSIHFSQANRKQGRSWKYFSPRSYLFWVYTFFSGSLKRWKQCRSWSSFSVRSSLFCAYTSSQTLFKMENGVDLDHRSPSVVVYSGYTQFFKSLFYGVKQCRFWPSFFISSSLFWIYKFSEALFYGGKQCRS